MPEHYRYLLIMLLSLAYPLAQSFEWRIRLFKRFKWMVPAILCTALVFIPWDVYFTRQGYWGFNEKFHLGVYIFSLPIEEWMFFILVPYCCFFVHFVLLYFFPQDILFPYRRTIGWGVVVLCALIGGLNFSQAYTASAFLGAASALLILLLTRFDFFLGRFWLTYIVCMIPFVVVNGQLTHPPVVWYNDAENLGLRLNIEGWANIPLDDWAYNMLLLSMNLGLYYYFRGAKSLELKQGEKGALSL